MCMQVSRLCGTGSRMWNEKLLENVLCASETLGSLPRGCQSLEATSSYPIPPCSWAALVYAIGEGGIKKGEREC